MPRKRASLSGGEAVDGSSVMSEGQLASFLSTFAQAQAESNRRLVESLLAASASSRDAYNLNPSPTYSPSPSCANAQPGNFANCTARFNGSSRDPDKLEAFLDSVEVYKDCKNVSDPHALKGLPMLLEDEAALWFRGVKATITSWDDALRKLRARFGVPKPPHKILREIYASEQGEERAEIFIGRLRALIAKMPYCIESALQVDIVYGLLDKRIRKRVTREAISDLDNLLEKAINIEESLAEAPSCLPRSQTASANIIARAQTSNERSDANGSRARSFNRAAATAPTPRAAHEPHAPTAPPPMPTTPTTRDCTVGGYPAKLKKVLIVTAPLWFKAPFRILRLFVREKLRERVHTVSAPQLGAHVPRASLPRQLGGPLEPDHVAWLEHCKNCYTNNLQNAKLDGVIDEYVISNHIPPVKPQNGMIEHEARDPSDRARADHEPAMHISDRDTPPYTCDPTPLRHTHGYNGDMKGRHNNINSGDEDDLDISTRGTWSSGEASPGLSDEECGGGGAGESAAALLARVRARGRRGLHAEYEEIRARAPPGTFHHAKLPSNLAKNRYTDVLCFDHSRVLLSQTDPDDPTTDYINANYVDGYKQKNAFICTQGPLPKTFGDFWRMVWEQGTLVIVMTTRAVERGRVKCGQYFPVTPGARVVHGGFAVTAEAIEQEEDYTVTHLLLTDLRTEQTRRVWHGQYTRWPDYGVPGGAGGGGAGRAAPVLRFLTAVRRAQQRALADLGDAWAGHSRGPPIVVHCSAGIGRTGTFLTLDICASRLAAERAVDVRGAVERVRAQRAHSIQMPDQYVFCHLAVIEYAVMNGYLESAELSGFDEDNEDESE